MCTNVPHKHRDLIIAWANGIKIQYKSGNLWRDVPLSPAWVSRTEYRIKPTPVVARYRRYLAKNVNCVKVYTVNENDYTAPKEVEGYSTFIKWIDNDWQEYVIEE